MSQAVTRRTWGEWLEGARRTAGLQRCHPAFPGLRTAISKPGAPLALPACPRSNLFTIHGLWPNSADGNHPASCPTDQSFDPAALPSTLRSRMECEWPSYTGSSDSFWSYE